MSTSTWPWYEYAITDDDGQPPAAEPTDVCKYHKKQHIEKYQERAYSTKQHAEVEAAIKKRIVRTLPAWPLCNYECEPIGLYYQWERDTNGMWLVTPYWQCLLCAMKGGKK